MIVGGWLCHLVIAWIPKILIVFVLGCENRTGHTTKTRIYEKKESED